MLQIFSCRRLQFRLLTEAKAHEKHKLQESVSKDENKITIKIEQVYMNVRRHMVPLLLP